MHPILKPALRRAWRDLSTLQFGVAPAHAVVLGPVDTVTAGLMDLLDGTRGVPLLCAEAESRGVPGERMEALVEGLCEAGLVDDARGGGEAAEALRARAGVPERLRADAGSLSLADRTPAGAWRRLAARRATRVRVRGAGRVGALLASVLSGAGVGQVEVVDDGSAEPWDVAPGGLPPEAVGERRAEAARREVGRSAPDRPAREYARGAGPAVGRGGAVLPGPDHRAGLSLVVVAPRDGLAAHAPDPAVAEPFLAAGIPHLYAGVLETTGMVGPLVLPGTTACAGCLDRHRAERDPAWSKLLVQWRSGRAPRGAACDLALAVAVAGLAAGHALAFLDGDEPTAAGTRWQADTPGLRWRCDPVPPHRNCPCGAHHRNPTAVERGDTTTGPAGSGGGGRRRGDGAVDGTAPGDRVRKRKPAGTESGRRHATMAGRPPSAAGYPGWGGAHV